MARKPREKSNSGFYHVVNRGLEKKAVFAQMRERTRMENLIRENYEKYQIEIYAYCIMPNHFHLLLKAELEALASFMAVISAKYAFYYNYKHNRTGIVFQNRFRSQCVEDESYFWNCVRYIHMNPVKAGLSNTLTGYKHSSIKEYCSNVSSENKILVSNIVELMEKRYASTSNFIEFHRYTDRDFYIGTKEEELEQRKAAAKEILEEYAGKLGAEAIEILEYAELRVDFEKQLKEKLGISMSKARQIRDMIRKETIKK